MSKRTYRRRVGSFSFKRDERYERNAQCADQAAVLLERAAPHQLRPNRRVDEEMDRGSLAIAALCVVIVLSVVVWAVLLALVVKLLFL